MFPADSEEESPRASGLGGPLMGKRPRLGDGAGAPKRSAKPEAHGDRDAGAPKRGAKPGARLELSSSPAAGGSSGVPPWADRILQSTAAHAAGLGAQRRRLVLETAFSGIGSIRRVLDKLGYSVLEGSACELKESAYKFCSANGTVAEHFFRDIRDLLSDGAGPCRVHGHCRAPGGRPDILHMGFPCQPYSGQRSGSRSAEEVMRHHAFKGSDYALDYCKKRRPYLALFENVPKFGADHDGSDDGGASEPSAPEFADSGGAPEPAGSSLPRGSVVNFLEEWCQKLRSEGYHVAWSLLDLDCWVQAHSTRIYIFAVSADIGGEEVVARAQALAQATQRARAESSPDAWQSAILSPGTDAWVRRHLSEHEVAGRGVGDNFGHKWEKQAEALREQWARARKPHWDSRPWTSPASSEVSAPQFRGLPRPVAARSLVLMDLAFLATAYKMGLDPQDGANRSTIVADLLVDLSQNPQRKPWGQKLRRATRGWRPYVFSLDRRLWPEEGFALYGWHPVNLSSLSGVDSWDLLGDSTALQTLAVATQALLMAAGPRVPGLWAGSSGASLP